MFTRRMNLPRTVKIGKCCLESLCRLTKHSETRRLYTKMLPPPAPMRCTCHASRELADRLSQSRVSCSTTRLLHPPDAPTELEKWNHADMLQRTVLFIATCLHDQRKNFTMLQHLPANSHPQLFRVPTRFYCAPWRHTWAASVSWAP